MTTFEKNLLEKVAALPKSRRADVLAVEGSHLFRQRGQSFAHLESFQNIEIVTACEFITHLK